MVWAWAPTSPVRWEKSFPKRDRDCRLVLCGNARPRATSPSSRTLLFCTWVVVDEYVCVCEGGWWWWSCQGPGRSQTCAMQAVCRGVVRNGYLEGETGQGAVGADDRGEGDGPGVAHVVVRQQQRAQHGPAGRLQDHVRRDRLTAAQHTRINNTAIDVKIHASVIVTLQQHLRRGMCGACYPEVLMWLRSRSKWVR